MDAFPVNQRTWKFRGTVEGVIRYQDEVAGETEGGGRRQGIKRFP